MDNDYINNVNNLIQFCILVVLTLYAFASYKLTQELNRINELNSKQMRLFEFRIIYDYRLKEFKRVEDISFDTLYMQNREQEEKMVKEILLDIKTKSEEVMKRVK